MPPTVTGGDKGPIKRKVVLSKSLILECEAGGHPPPSLTWLKDGVPVRDGASVRVLEQGKKLEIPSAAVSDSGHYICVATSIAGEKEVKYDVRVLGINRKSLISGITTSLSIFFLECYPSCHYSDFSQITQTTADGETPGIFLSIQNAHNAFLSHAHDTVCRKLTCLFACMLSQEVFGLALLFVPHRFLYYIQISVFALRKFSLLKVYW